LKITLLAGVLASPILIFLYFTYGLISGWYPWDADAIAVPITIYWIMVLPPFAFLALKGRKGLRSSPIHLFWNSKKHLGSALWTVITIFPIGICLQDLFWDSFHRQAWLASAYFLFLLAALVIYRAGAISLPQAGPAETNRSHSG